MQNAHPKRSPALRILDALSWCLNSAVTSLNALGTLIIIALMVLICADVVSRNVFASSLPGVIELAELGIVSIVFLQIADTVKSGKLMRSDALINVINGLYPRVAITLNIFFDATGAVLFYFIANGAFGRFLSAWSGGFYLGNLGSFTVPTWPMELCVALGSTLMFLLFTTKALKGGLALVRGTQPPPPAPDYGSEYDA
ncbi:TRAP transporter small permease [Roseibium sp. MMSF_3544]|uniref:TRAP transporter small permease n=1 Tax=unclassified Roseibium TaxID=2629323 RepID=UPI0027400390|nr:TRAP transporter small permease [Roseibium sp. MMSF_3544]